LSLSGFDPLIVSITPPARSVFSQQSGLGYKLPAKWLNMEK
jgi:hypothetical protein